MKVSEIEEVLRKYIDREGLARYYEYLSNMLLEEPPITPEDCFSLIGDFLTDGMVYSKDEAFDLCIKLVPILFEKGIRDDLRNSIVPKCLPKSVCIGEISDDIEYDLVKTENMDVMLDYDKFTADSNSELLIDWNEEDSSLANKKTKKELAAIEKQMEQMRKQKKARAAIVPVEGSNLNHKMDVLVNNVTIVVAGKTLLENATLRLTHGRKYGLVGRNGIGKTTLLNALACKEVEGFPMHLNVLLVDQELDMEDGGKIF